MAAANGQQHPSIGLTPWGADQGLGVVELETLGQAFPATALGLQPSPRAAPRQIEKLKTLKCD